LPNTPSIDVKVAEQETAGFHDGRPVVDALTTVVGADVATTPWGVDTIALSAVMMQKRRSKRIRLPNKSLVVTLKELIKLLSPITLL